MISEYVTEFQGRNIMSWEEYDRVFGKLPFCPKLKVIINLRDHKESR